MTTQRIPTIENFFVPGKTDSSGKQLETYTINFDDNFKIKLMNLGLVIEELWVKNRENNLQNVVYGLSTSECYLDNPAFLGCVVGRVANRIDHASFSIAGKEYQLLKNDGQNHLHGGKLGLSRKVWDLESHEVQENLVRLNFCYFSKSGEEGYPEDVHFSAEWKISKNRIALNLQAHCNKSTPISLTHHSYFNLEKLGAGISQHSLQLNSNEFLELTSEGIPTERLIKSEGSALDFSTPRKIQVDQFSNDPLLEHTKGIDHYFKTQPFEVPLPATEIGSVSSQVSGIRMKVVSNSPGAQVYSGNFMQGVKSTSGVCKSYDAICIEPHLPVNFINMEACKEKLITNKENPYTNQIIYEFDII